MANTTWNPSDITASVTLSGGNLIATCGAVGNLGVRAIDRQATGKFYWEVTPTVLAGTSAVGIGLQSMALNNGFSNPGIVGGFVLNSSGSGFINGATTILTSMGSFATSAPICCALDLTDELFWIRNGAAANWNGQAAANPATGAMGIPLRQYGLSNPQVPLYPILLFTNANTTSFTANFGDSAFAGTVPSGFTSGFTSGASIPTSAIVPSVIRESLYAQANPQLHLSGIVREVLRTTGTGAGTFIAVDGHIREVLRSSGFIAPPTSGPFVSIIQ